MQRLMIRHKNDHPNSNWLMIFSIGKHVDEYEKERIGLNVKNKGVIGERT